MSVRRLIESTFVTLGGDIGSPQVWGPPYLSGPEQGACARELLFGADALVLGRVTYEGLSAAYTAMAAGEPDPVTDFVAAMNAIPKYVASRTLTEVGWNASLLGPDVAADSPGSSSRTAATCSSTGPGRWTRRWWSTGWWTSSASGSCR